jgi:hypothetical protein
MSYFKFAKNELKLRIEKRFGDGGQINKIEIDKSEWADIVMEIYNLEMMLDELTEVKTNG